MGRNGESKIKRAGGTPALRVDRPDVRGCEASCDGAPRIERKTHDELDAIVRGHSAGSKFRRLDGDLMSEGKGYNVLFLCTGNSARSIMAEAILNRKGRPTFHAYSAGSHPSGRVRPEALRQLERAQLPTEGLRSKDWAEFEKAGAPQMNFVFTVCDNAAKEVCPVWPGQPMTAHWGVPDPAAVEGTPEDIERAFRDAFMILDRRISLLLCLPIASLDKLAIKREIDRIGRE
jgi:arsenate reductase (thioredoxin)